MVLSPISIEYLHMFHGFLPASLWMISCIPFQLLIPLLTGKIQAYPAYIMHIPIITVLNLISHLLYKKSLVEVTYPLNASVSLKK
jgi:hypothetical protein